jgi:2-aminoethylphosphonate-pyruvate transaminase
LVPNNGAYCQRIVRILGYLGRQTVVMDHREDEPASPERIEATLAADATITHVALVHCETGTGILNPLHEIAQRVAYQGRGLIVDAMSSFAALPIDLGCTPIDALIAASGKCLEGVPGMGFVITRQDKIAAATGNSHSLALDLHDQWLYMQKTGQWRFTPPTHVVAALRAALDQFHAEGGTAARGARYQNNCNTLVKGMRALGLHTFLADELQAPIIVTFHAPDHPNFDFTRLYQGVRDKGFILYPGKLTQIETFRVGCIGAIGAHEISLAVDAISQTLREQGIRP